MYVVPPFTAFVGWQRLHPQDMSAEQPNSWGQPVPGKICFLTYGSKTNKKCDWAIFKVKFYDFWGYITSGREVSALPISVKPARANWTRRLFSSLQQNFSSHCQSVFKPRAVLFPSLRSWPLLHTLHFDELFCSNLFEITCEESWRDQIWSCIKQLLADEQSQTQTLLNQHYHSFLNQLSFTLNPNFYSKSVCRNPPFCNHILWPHSRNAEEIEISKQGVIFESYTAWMLDI